MKTSIINTSLLLALCIKVVVSTKDAVALTANDESRVHVLVYETEEESVAQSLLNQVNALYGFTARQFGQGHEFEGYGSKFSAVMPILREMPSDSLVVISDSRDVLINNPANDDTYTHSWLVDFQQAYDAVTFDHPGAIVISAEAQCCVSALTHVAPGSYYNEDGSRNEKACSSGEEGCLWNGDEMAEPWQAFMEELAFDRISTQEDKFDDVYLNAGLMAGTAADLIRVLSNAKIENNEDDQAVLTDYMFRNPKDIVLDYGQTLFGNNRGGTSDGCVMGKSDTPELTRLVHSKTNSVPLFLHSPGGYFKCHDKMADLLGGVETVTKQVRKLLKKKDRKLGCNYSRGRCDPGEDEEEAEDARRPILGNLLGGLRGGGDDSDEDNEGGLFRGGGLLGRGGNDEDIFDGNGNGLFNGRLRDRLGGRDD